MHSQTPPLRLPVDIDELADALNQGNLDIQYYLDLETGELVLITDDIRVALEDIYEALERQGEGDEEGIEEEAGEDEEDDGEEEDEEECDDEDDEEQEGDEEDEDDDDWSEDQVAAAIDADGSLVLEKEDLLAAHRIDQGSNRYLAVPTIPSSEAYRDMEDFMNTVPNRSLYQSLQRALAGRKPFRRFKDALGDHPEEMQRYLKEIARRSRERALEWLDEEGIDPVPRRPPASRS